MRIAFLDSWLQQTVDGSGTAAAINGLGRALRVRGHHVTRIGPPSAWPPATTPRRLLFNTLYIPPLLHQLQYDLIVGFDIDGFHIASVASDPYICSIKGVIAEELQHERGIIRRLLWALSRLERINARRAPLVLTTSNYCRQKIAEHYGLPDWKVRIIPEGIDLAHWRTRLSSSGSSTRDDHSILCVARQYSRKHIADLLHAFAALRLRFPKACLTIIGDGPEHQALKNLAATLGLGPEIRLLGPIPNDNDVLDWYRRSTIFCLPSVQEGFGIVFLEAMAAGLPIVATNAAAIPEVVPDRKAGILVPPGDVPALTEALAELLARPDLRAAYGAFGQHYVERYDWHIVAAIFLEAIADQIRV
ncbi:MAG: glycosyltransferase family 4 protein [Oscillochloris sp.]|nr:glycosyltransferase family 4 protein [Oscillochloris sp.]